MGFYQAQKIEKLEARIAELEDKLKDEEYISKDTNEMFHEVSGENIELRARIAELEAALKPFADDADIYEIDDMSMGLLELFIDVSDLLAARAALGENDDSI